MRLRALASAPASALEYVGTAASGEQCDDLDHQVANTPNHPPTLASSGGSGQRDAWHDASSAHGATARAAAGCMESFPTTVYQHERAGNSGERPGQRRAQASAHGGDHRGADCRTGRRFFLLFLGFGFDGFGCAW